MIAQNWMQSGIIQDPHIEFFIQRIDSVMIKSQDDLKIDWDNEFRLRHWVDRNNKDCPLQPKVLKGIAQTILDAGKSIRLTLYFKAHPQNEKITLIKLKKPCIYTSILERITETLSQNFEDLIQIKSEVCSTNKKYTRPSFNSQLKSEFYSITEKPAQEVINLAPGKWGQRQMNILKTDKPRFIDNELDGINLQPQLTLFDRLLTVTNENMLTKFSKKKLKGDIKEVTMTHSDHQTQEEIQKQLRVLIGCAIKKAKPGYILHKDVNDAYLKGISLTSQLISSNLGELLNLSFEIELLMKTVWYSANDIGQSSFLIEFI